MSMPKGMKHENGYATVDGPGYREIAETMTEQGYKMNHATARNYFIRALTKLAKPLCDEYGTGHDPAQVAKNPHFQSAIASLIKEVEDDINI